MKIGVDCIGITTPFYCTDGKGNFLFHKRSNKCRDEKGRWDAGGGQLEWGETLEQNVLREVQEEYGCSAKILQTLPPYTLLRTEGKTKTHWMAFPFLLLVNPDKVRNNEPEKIIEIGWFPLNRLPHPLHTGVNIALKKYRPLLMQYAKTSSDLI